MTKRTGSRRGWLCAGVAVLALAPCLAHAQSPEDLGKLVISANRTATEAHKVGSSVTVVTAEDLKNKQATTLEEALEDIPGLYVYSNGNSRNNTRFRLRGFDSGRVLVLIDGVKIDNQASQMYDRPYNHLQAADIERVEVLRGNQSSLYGSDAIGGVISITTKGGRKAEKIIQGEVEGEVGSFVTRRASAVAWGRYEDVYYKASAAGLATHGYDTQPNRKPDENDGSRSKNYNFQLGSDLVKDYGVLDLLNIEGSYTYMDGTAEYDTSTANTNGFMGQTTETARLQVKADLFDGMLANTFSVSGMDAYVQSRANRYAAAAPNRYWGDLQRYEYQGVLKPFEGHQLVFGADQERDHFRSQTSTAQQNAALVNSSVFADYAVDVLDDLTLTVGGREYYHDTFGKKFTYRTTASYRIPESGSRLHGSYGTAFKAPSLIQALYNRSTAVADGYGDTVNPEEARGYDVGIEQSLLDDRVVLDVTFFNNHMQDAIEARGPSGNRYYYNIGSVRSMGVESSASIHVSDEVDLNFVHTYTQARNNQTGMAIEEQPVHTASLRLSYQPNAVEGLSTWGRVNVASGSWNASSGNRSRIEGYGTVDLGATYDVNETFSIYGRIENLFDQDYGQMYDFSNAGVAGYMGVRAKF